MASTKHIPVLVRASLERMGIRLAGARKARALTQGDLAGLAGVGLSTVVSLEGGHDGVSVGNLLKVLDAMSLLDQFERVADLDSDPQVLQFAKRRLGAAS